MASADEAERYRKAAHMTLDQLDWCVEYLQRLHKAKLSRQLADNTMHIRQRLNEPRGNETVTREQPG